MSPRRSSVWRDSEPGGRVPGSRWRNLNINSVTWRVQSLSWFLGCEQMSEWLILLNCLVKTSWQIFCTSLSALQGIHQDLWVCLGLPGYLPVDHFARLNGSITSRGVVGFEDLWCFSDVSFGVFVVVHTEVTSRRMFYCTEIVHVTHPTEFLVLWPSISPKSTLL